MSTNIDIELSKQLLVACDQSYFTSKDQVLNKPLQDLFDKAADAPAEYGNPNIYALKPQFVPASGYTVVAVIDRSEQSGAKALVYLNTTTNEVIVAFGGTDGINAQDWTANTQDVGWKQWQYLNTTLNKGTPTEDRGVLDAISEIANTSGIKASGGLQGIHFTGQSLGGALAQYAAFEFFRDARFEKFDGKKVSLLTFNGLGAKLGLTKKPQEGETKNVYTDAEIDGFNKKLGQVAHYVVDNDIVSRLGGGHIGSGGEVIKFDWTYLADAANGVKAGKPMDFIDAHRIETAFYTHLRTGNEFADGKVVKEKSSDFPLIDVPGAVKWAGYLGNLFNDQTVTPAEGLFRLIAGLIGGTVAADANEIDTVVQAAIDAKHRSEKMGEFKYSILKNINFGYVGKLAFFNKIGLSLYLGSILGSVAIDFVSGGVELLKKAGSWISSLFGKELDIPTVQASTEKENVLRLQAALAAEPDAWKDAESKKKAQELKDKLGGVTLTDEMAKAAVTGGDHWPRECALALAEGILANPAAQSLTPNERASLVAQAESNYWSFLTAGARQEPALLAKVVADMNAFWHSDIGNAVAKLNPDYLKAGDSALALAGLDGYASRKSFTDALLDGIKSAANMVFSALSGTAYAEEAKAGFEQTATNIKNASEMIVLRAGSGANPFNSESFDPDAEPVSASNLREGGGQSFSVYIPYAAGKDGQKFKLNLAGSAAYAFDVYIKGMKLPGNATEFELTIEAGKREATFTLFALRDVDADETLGLTAQLVDSSGQPTHQSHLELNLAFDATEENETSIQYVRSKILEDTMPENDPAGESFSGSEDRFATWSIVGTNNNDVIHGAEAGDWLQGEAGNDLIYGAGGRDEIRGGDGDDLLAGGHGWNLNPDDLPDEADLLIGGDGLDRLYGMEGDDRLYGGDFVDTAVAIEQAGQFAETTLAEFFEGGEGDDLLVGGTSNYLFGGAGADLIVGGGGNDIAQGDTFDSGYSTGLDKIAWRLDYNEAKRKSYVYLERVENGQTELYSRFGYEDADGKGDTIITGAGNDIALGESGDDFLMLGDGADIGIGGEGNDTIEGGDGADRIMGDFNWDASAPDGTESEAELMNYAGLEGQYHGNDTLHGGAGDDSIEGNGGDDFIDGGEGRDSIHGDDGITLGDLHGKDIVDGGEGDDSLFGDGSDDELYGGAGEDELSGDSDWLDGQYHGNDYLDGGEGADKLWGNGGGDELFGGGGDDYLEGDYADLDGQYHGADYLDGEDGNDVLIGEGGSDQLFGGSGADTLLGDDSPEAPLAAEFHGDDYLDGEAGDDTLIGGGGNDQLMGGEGKDKLYGDGDTAATGGDDYLDGEAGDDLLSGDGGNDILMGGDGDDSLLGGDGNDQLIGGAGADYLAGGAGNDTYIFAAGDSPTNGAGQNEVVDDLSGNNTVRFESAYLGGIKVAADASGGYLVIDYTEGDRLLVKNGMAGSVAAYEFADGDRLSFSELIGRMSDAILYSTGPEGTEYAMGGFDSDTMQATHGSTLISGGRGDDTIMGSGGNNTYLYSHGDGNDVIHNQAISSEVDILRFGEQIGKGDISLLRRLNGDLLLSLNDGSGSVVLQGWYAKPENRIARITFADGSAFTSEELFTVPLIGTADGDVMVGSEHSDTIEGLAGNDVLDGGAGNDTLIGGEGVDAYILKHGMGKDTVVDASAGGNAIKLVPGLDFASLDAERKGNDLFVHIHGSDQGMVLQDYYTNPQSWVVQNDAGEQQDVAQIVAATEAAEQDMVGGLWRDYLAQTRNSFSAIYLSRGYQAAADGSLYRPWSMSDDARWVSAYVSESGSIIQSTYQYFDGTSYSLNLSYPNIYWITNKPYMYEASAALTNLVTVSDEAVIYSQGREMEFSSSQWVTAKIDWQPAVNWTNQSSWTYSWREDIYDGRGIAIGIGSHVSENYSRTGYAYGTVTDIVTDGSAALSTGDHPQYVLANLGTYTYTVNIEEITAGASDNLIYGNNYTLVDAGDGNDTVDGAGLAYGGAGNDVLSNGQFLIGGSGDDTLSNGQVLIGGAGNDTMDGGYGATRYVFEPGDTGADLVMDSADYEDGYKDWYYNSIGIQDWQEREATGNKWWVVEGPSFDTYEEAVAYFAGRGVTSAEEQVANGNLFYVPPLPALNRPAANDYAALQTLYDEGLIPVEAVDTLELPSGITLADLALALGEVMQVSPATGLEVAHRTLDISWNAESSKVRIVIPNADDPLGSGIEQVRFADGTLASMAELIAKVMAGPTDGDPVDGAITGTDQEDYLDGTSMDDTLRGLGGNDGLHGFDGNDTLIGGAGNDYLDGGNGTDAYVFNVGDGVDILYDSGDDGAVNRLVFGEGIALPDLSLALDANGLSNILLVGQNGDAIQTFYGFQTGDVFEFADGSTITYGEWANPPGSGGTATPGDDDIYGTDGADTLDGGLGNDYLEGGFGDDTYLFGRGYGQDVVWDYDTTPGNVDTLRFAPDILPSDISVSVDRWGSLVLAVKGTDDTLTLDSTLSNEAGRVEQVVFADGTTWSLDDLAAMVSTSPTSGVDYITGTTGNDTLDGLAGDDGLVGRQGQDILHGGQGADVLLEDWVIADATNDYLDGGEGDDDLYASVSNDLVIGGGGNDYVWSDGGNDVVLFNRGDGFDTWDGYARDDVATAQKADTLSLGGGIAYADLSFGRNGDHLFLNTGNGEGIMFIFWFNSSWQDYKAVKTLQIIAEGMAGYDRNSADPLLNQRVLQFDFLALASRFEAELLADPGLTEWRLEPHLAEYYLGGSDSEAIGGKLAYVYGRFGNLDSVPEAEIREQLGDARFGVVLQQIDGTATAQETLLGTAGADTLTSLAGNTTFNGGQGSDTLVASGGGNTYVYNTGDGSDIIIDTSKADGADSPNALVFGPGITPDQVTLSLGSLMLRIGDNPEDVIHIEGFDPDRPFDLPAIDEFRFADGTVLGYADLLQKGFDLQGDDGDNVITGTALDDRISGGAGQDRLAGGAGDDVLSGGTGRDAYDFNLGDGNDVLQDDMAPAEDSLLVFGEGISRDSLRFEQETGGLRIRYGDTDSVLLAGYDPAGNPAAARVEFADGSTASLDELMNAAPVAAELLVDQVAMEDTAFAFSVPAAAFSDANTGDALTYMATSGNGSVLPAWLSFDPLTRSFSGTPGNSDVGQFSVRVIATDRWGKSAEQVFNLAVANVNDAPIAMATIDEQLALEDAPFAFQLPADAFSDVDAGDALTYRATLDDGSPLPAWLSFDPATLAFSGTPANGDVGSVRVAVTATDMAEASASEVFILNVANVNDAPVLMQAMDNPITQEDAPFTLALPADLFADVDAGDGLSYSATLADGSALPAWLAFDEASQTFSGTPGNDDVGTLDVRVTATDMAGASASTAFALAVQNVNDAPVLRAPWGNRAAVEDAAFAFAVPADAFADVDQGDVLAYSAMLSDGSALPAWLSFDAATRTFSGTPENGDVGSLSVTVTATDLAGTSTSTTFAMEVANVNDAPTAAVLADQATLEDAPFSFTLPSDAFADADSIHGDSLSYGATLADGSALPAWLSFDAANRTFSGTPANADVGIVQVAVSATDSGGLSAASRFDIEVRNVNDAPVAANPLVDQTVKSGAGFLYQLPAGSFTDEDQGDTLSYSAKLADGSALPSWLKFDSATQTFSGQVPNNAKGSLDIQVVASDGHGAESIASDVFRVSFTKGGCGGHGNEGVGNGQDAPPPGHGDNWNDGPGTSPGHPGSRDDRDDDGHAKPGRKACGDEHDGKPKDDDRNRLFSPPYLDLKKLDRHVEAFSGGRREADTSATVARWIEVDLAVSRQRAMEDKSLPWLREGNGADIAALHHASAGFLGSKTGCGADAFSLAAGAGTQLKAFHGLQEGMRKIA